MVNLFTIQPNQLTKILNSNKNVNTKSYLNKIISANIKEREQTPHLDSSLYIHPDQDILL